MSSSPFLNAISQAMRQKGYALKTEKPICSGLSASSCLKANSIHKRCFYFMRPINKKTERTHKAWLSSISIVCC